MSAARKLAPQPPPLIIVERKAGTPQTGAQFVGDVADVIDRLMRTKGTK